MVVVVFTATRIIKSVFAGQAPVTLELRNTAGKHQKQNKGGILHAYITADAVVVVVVVVVAVDVFSH